MSLEGSDGPITLPSGNLQALFAYLILHPDIPQPRTRLAHLLWPDTDPDRSGRNFSNLLYRLKKLLGPDWFTKDSENITLTITPDLWVDVYQFEHLISAGTHDALKQALTIYQGDLLPALYDDWVLIHRERLREAYLTTLLNLGNLSEIGNQPETGQRYYRQLLATDPLHEEAARGLMRCLGLLKRYSDALSVFASLTETLDTEIGVQPGLDTRLLADRLHNERALMQQTDIHPTPVHFVGRLIERARLLALLDRAGQGESGLVVILGEPGIGKTRLFDELAHSAAWRGWQIAWGQAKEFSFPTPYQPLAQALETALPSIRLEQLAQKVSAISLGVIRALVSGSPIPAITDISSSPPMEFVLREVLFGLQTITPCLILLDDAHWADPALWPLLDRFWPLMHDMRVLIALNLRITEAQTQPEVWKYLQKWDQEGVPVIRLTGLTLEELRELVTFRSLSNTQLERLAKTTGGNPLFALQLLDEKNLENRLAQDISLADLALQRVLPLSSQAQYALQIASVLGVEFDLSTWEAVLKRENIPVETLSNLAGEIERAGIFQLTQGGYRFAHDTLRASIYTNMPEQVRKNFHRQVLSVLSQKATTRVPDLLYHAQQTEAKLQIAMYAHQSGEQALNSFNYAAAAKYFTLALESIPETDKVQRYRTLVSLTRAYEILGSRDDQLDGLVKLQALIEHLGDASRQTEVARLFARYYWQTGNYAEAIEAGSRGLEMALITHDTEMQAALLETLGRTARDQGDYAKAKEQFEQALQRYQMLGHEAGQGLVLNNLGILAQRQGYPSEAIQFNLRACELFRQLGDIYAETRSLGNLGVAYWTSGDYARAREMFEQALVANQQIGDRRAEITYLSNLGGLFGILGKPENALERYEAALKLTEESGEKAIRASLLANRGVAYYDLGQWKKALASLDKALALNQQIGRRRGEGYVLYSRGITLIESGRFSEAQESLESSLTIRHELGERDNLTDTYCTLTRFHLSQGRQEQAEQAFLSAQDFHNPKQDSTEIRRNYHYTAYLLQTVQGNERKALNHLLQAEEAMQSMAQAIPEEDRPRFLNLIAVNRKIQQALAKFSKITEIQLARINVPRGKKLVEEDYVQVNWTLVKPGDDLITPLAARRQHIIHRLITEAIAQGALPTDDDLAQALDVSRRTILRDIQRLQEQGMEIKTRQRGG